MTQQQPEKTKSPSDQPLPAPPCSTPRSPQENSTSEEIPLMSLSLRTPGLRVGDKRRRTHDEDTERQANPDDDVSSLELEPTKRRKTDLDQDDDDDAVDPGDEDDDGVKADIDTDSQGQGQGQGQETAQEARRRETLKREIERVNAHMKEKFLSRTIVGIFSHPSFVLQEIAQGPFHEVCEHCVHPKREDAIRGDGYRIALHPPFDGETADVYYHVHCLEDILRLSVHYHTVRLRPATTEHVPDWGAKCILDEFISRWKERVARLSISVPDSRDDDWGLDQETWKPTIDDEGDDPSWTIRGYLLCEKAEHRMLSDALDAWYRDKTLARKQLADITDDEERTRWEKMGEATRNRIKQYAQVDVSLG